MSDAPETIWIDALGIPDSKKYAGTYYLNEDEDHHTVEYRRADLPLTTDQLMTDPRVQALVEHLSFLASESECKCVWHSKYRESLYENGKCPHQIARAVVAQLKEPKE